MNTKYPVFRFRLSPELRKEMIEAAKKKGVKTSRFIKDLIIREIQAE